MLTTFINAPMTAEADAVCGAEYGARSEARNGHRHRDSGPRMLRPVVSIGFRNRRAFFQDQAGRLADAAPGVQKYWVTTRTASSPVICCAGPAPRP